MENQNYTSLNYLYGAGLTASCLLLPLSAYLVLSKIRTIDKQATQLEEVSSAPMISTAS